MTQTLWAGGGVAFLMCWALVLTQRWHGRFTLDPAQGVQKFHIHPTPRVGGIGIMAGLCAVWLTAPLAWNSILEPLMLASVPAFVFGLAEDLTKSVGARARLLATMGSGVLASLITGTMLTHTSIPALDGALQNWWPLALLFTAIAVGGVANAVNIMDGFNGLASGLVIICLCALGVIALETSDTVLASVMFTLAAVVGGFLLVNFPLGKIFLGDGGAYVLGFWLAWLAVLLMERNPSVSPAAVLLACAYPVTEVLFSMVRRIRRSHHPMHPDRLHLHSLVKFRLARKRLGHWPTVMQNASVSPFVWIMASWASVLGILFWNQATAAWSGLAAFTAAYILLYRRLALFGWR